MRESVRACSPVSDFEKETTSGLSLREKSAAAGGGCFPLSFSSLFLDRYIYIALLSEQRLVVLLFS